MGNLRCPLQGVGNIVRFNWPFYIVWVLAVFAAGLAAIFIPEYRHLLLVVVILLTLPVVISLMVSWYVYDYSRLYSLVWLDALPVSAGGAMLHIHSGFDEMSGSLRRKYPQRSLQVYDFYDETRHTELSIRRARSLYPASDSVSIRTDKLPDAADDMQTIFLLLSAHEIRQSDERAIFFRELYRVLRDDGEVVLTEHLRSLPNFLAYSIGFLHFHSRSTWEEAFAEGNFFIAAEYQITPFITTFVLKKNGDTSADSR